MLPFIHQVTDISGIFFPMSNSTSDIQGAIKGIDQSKSIQEIREVLTAAQKRLRSMPDDSAPVDRARALLDVAEPLLGLGLGEEAWQNAREAFSVFVDYEHWQDAVEAADILYQCDQKDSISALGQGIWLAVTYPVRAQSTVTLLDHVIDETPDDSDGAAARVAKRQRGIEDQETLNTWIEMYQLNDIPELFKRLAVILDVLVGETWWFDRDALRAKLPVN